MARTRSARHTAAARARLASTRAPAAIARCWTPARATLQGGRSCRRPPTAAPSATTNWAAGWTKLDTSRLLHATRSTWSPSQTDVHTAYGANVTPSRPTPPGPRTTPTSWRSQVFVTNGATLTIEPGTTIYGARGTPSDDTFGSLIITRGCKIERRRHRCRADRVHSRTRAERDFAATASSPLATALPRLWGGLIILGRAILNDAGNPFLGGNTLNRGLQPRASRPDGDGRADVIDLRRRSTTATTAAPCSYVSIRYGGYEFDTDEEINGLTLGGVGSGTDIYLRRGLHQLRRRRRVLRRHRQHQATWCMAFNEDESFDIDQGYRGHRPVLVRHPEPVLIDGVTSGHDNGGEWDGVTGTIADDAGQLRPDDLQRHLHRLRHRARLPATTRATTRSTSTTASRARSTTRCSTTSADDLIESAGDGPGTGLDVRLQHRRPLRWRHLHRHQRQQPDLS